MASVHGNSGAVCNENMPESEPHMSDTHRTEPFASFSLGQSGLRQRDGELSNTGVLLRKIAAQVLWQIIDAVAQ